ncbi:MAG: T9SS type A sorting domain-containing protein [Owenweeksia sp.]|nr:T9SS type A sorting domain-containing protein [Owenweeksia sp.]
MKEHSGVRVFPNPTTGQLHLEWPFSSQHFDRLQVFNIHGKIVHRQFIEENDNLELQLKGAKGVYLYSYLGVKVLTF